MLNEVVLVGRTTDEAKFGLDKNARVTLAVQHPFKSPNGKNDVDFIPVNFYQFHVDMMTRVHKGSIIAITGRIGTAQRTSKLGNVYYGLEVFADTLSVIKFKDVKEEVAEMPEVTPSVSTEECEDIDLDSQENNDYTIA